MQTRRRVLVTGATGQIGYMTFRRLLDQPDEYDAYGLDRTRDASARVPGSWALDIPDDRFRVCDISDYNQVREAVEGMDVVAHLAADPGSGDWESLLSSNIIASGMKARPKKMPRGKRRKRSALRRAIHGRP